MKAFYSVAMLLIVALFVSACSTDDASCWAPSQQGSGAGGAPVVTGPTGGLGDEPAPTPQGEGGSSELDGSQCQWGCRCVGVYGSLAHPLPPSPDGSELELYHCAYDESRSYTRCADLDTALRESCVREHQTARPHKGWVYDTTASIPQQPCRDWFNKP